MKKLSLFEIFEPELSLENQNQEQEQTADSEHMSVQQIARAIEDTVVTDSEETTSGAENQ